MTARLIEGVLVRFTERSVDRFGRETRGVLVVEETGHEEPFSWRSFRGEVTRVDVDAPADVAEALRALAVSIESRVGIMPAATRAAEELAMAKAG